MYKCHVSLIRLVPTSNSSYQLCMQELLYVSYNIYIQAMSSLFAEPYFQLALLPFRRHTSVSMQRQSF